ncbi:hypothetical protein LQ567_18065 [Niabella pedocola]|uniref:Chemotaxis methyl-accepting receptor HlyB-like 4HB MCP domain-containing protein n=1 Tax=Niabella pedocola TaxID=1752077 RepID=A0ABS8PUF2_9BACT|nr:hypothetical protein [Niabella pedocola]MCD2424693.1 hypothetical protein [Niabella pedocola]
MALQQRIKDTLTQGRLHKTILSMLLGLWGVSIVLILGLVISWRLQENSERSADVYQHPSLDEMLLSFSELKLGNNTTLINLQLKEIAQISQKKSNTDTTNKEIIADYRKKIYDRMLEEKIKTRQPRQPLKQEGFTIKPVPQ